jgi:hypothetical protein
MWLYPQFYEEEEILSDLAAFEAESGDIAAFEAESGDIAAFEAD